MPSTNKKLVVTNYDNFKDATFFLKQYHTAQKMLKEVNDFFTSFYLSKLMTSADLKNVHPVMFNTESSWVKHFIPYNVMDRSYDYVVDEVLHGTPLEKACTYVTPEEYETRKKEVKKNAEILRDQASLLLLGKFDCYFVTDDKGILHEFIPVNSKETIDIEIKKKEIIVSGHFYSYSEYGGNFGRSVSHTDKVIKKIIIDPATNNIKDVKTIIENVSSGNANGKSYWDEHECYALTKLSGKNKVSTLDWDNIIKQFERKKQQLAERIRYNLGETDDEDRKQYRKELHQLFDERYELIYKKPLSDEVLNEYFGAYIGQK